MMFQLEKIVRPNVLSLKPYSSARDEYQGQEGIFLDANESPYGSLNRYPDPYQKTLKNRLAALKHMPAENIFIGNGSDEVIDVLFRIFCHPGKDRVIICPPTYGMYEVSAGINDVEVIRIPLNEDFQLDIDHIAVYGGENETVKMIFLCSPNNPTGNVLHDLEKVLQLFKGIVIVDEAYIDFSSAPSLIEKLKEYPNLVVIQTFSKAWGLAAARVGIAFASSEVISLMNKIKPPYNVSKLNQQAAMEAMDNVAEFHRKKELILAQRSWLVNELSTIDFVHKIYPSEANFLLIQVTDADAIYRRLIERKVVTRNRSTVIKNCLRMTIGAQDENRILIEELKQIQYEKGLVY